MIETASFRPAIYATSEAALGSTQAFKTGAIDRSAIPPLEITRKSRCAAGPYTRRKRARQSADLIQESDVLVSGLGE